MRAREPDHEGFIERDGVRVGYAVFGAGEPTIILLTSWAITHAQQWKGQVPYLARMAAIIYPAPALSGRVANPKPPPNRRNAVTQR